MSGFKGVQAADRTCITRTVPYSSCNSGGVCSSSMSSEVEDVGQLVHENTQQGKTRHHVHNTIPAMPDADLTLPQHKCHRSFSRTFAALGLLLLSFLTPLYGSIALIEVMRVIKRFGAIGLVLRCTWRGFVRLVLASGGSTLDMPFMCGTVAKDRLLKEFLRWSHV